MALWQMNPASHTRQTLNDVIACIPYLACHEIVV